MATVQALLGDPTGQWVTRDYILPLLNISYGNVNLNVANASGKELEAVVPILDVPIGTTSLYPWQNGTAVPGMPPGTAAPAPLLAGLFDVIEVWAKPAGSPPNMYSRVRERDTLPHINPQQINNSWPGGSMAFTWQGNQLRITPANQPLDIEVTGKFTAQPLAEDKDLLVTHEDIWIPVTFDTAATAGVERSNPQVLAGYQAKALAAQDNVIAKIIRQRQGTPHRFQRMSRDCGLAQWFWC